MNNINPPTYADLSDTKAKQYDAFVNFPINSPIMYFTYDEVVQFGIVTGYKFNEFSEVILGIKLINVHENPANVWVHHNRVALIK